MEPSVGAVVAERFRLTRALGEGGMGVVWEAVHVVTRRPVALKFLKATMRDETETRQRFLREARAACAVKHPSVVQIHDVLELEDGSPVMVMDLLQGETLAVKLARERVLTLPELARILIPVCSAVAAAHAIGIVHRDLKPDNIFLADVHGAREVIVLDFGIAKLTAVDGDAARSGLETGTGALLGTPFYMAPEQIYSERDIDHRADMWAIGVIVYEALAGVRPTQAANIGQVFKLVTKDAIVPLAERAPDVPAPVLDLVARLLTQDRAKRPSDLREVVSVLSAYSEGALLELGAPGRTTEPVARDVGRSAPRAKSAVTSPRVSSTTKLVAAIAATALATVLFWRMTRATPTAATNPIAESIAAAPTTVASSSPAPAPSSTIDTQSASSSATPTASESAKRAPASTSSTPRSVVSRPAAQSSPSASTSLPTTKPSASAPPRDPGSYQ